MKRLGIVIAASMLAAGAAWAKPAEYTATLAQPVEKSVEYVIGDNVFRCEGTGCAIVSHPIGANSVSLCKKLVRKVGKLTAYGREGDQFSAEDLAKCNGE